MIDRADKDSNEKERDCPTIFLSLKSHILDRNWVWNDEDEEDYDDNLQFGLPG